MDNNIKTPAQVSTTVVPDYHRPFTSATGLSFWSIIFGLALPPLGLILAVFALYKAGQKSKKLALVFGCLGLAAVIAGSIFYTWIYHRHNQLSINNTYSYSAYDNYKLYGYGKGKGMTFTKPAVFTDKVGFPHNGSQVALTQTGRLTGYANAVTVASIDAVVTNPSVKITDAYLSNFDAMQLANKNDAATNSFRTTIYNFLSSSVVPGTTITLGAPKTFTNTSIKNHAWSYIFSASSTLSTGATRNMQGQLVYAVGKNNFYYFSVSAVKANWQANTNAWKQVFDSLKIDQ